MAKNIEKIGKYVKSHLTWDDEHNGWEGVVYTYTLDCPNDPKDGWKYVGCTPEESTRRYRWGLEKDKYGGRAIADAREKYGIKNFSYTVLETHYDPDIDKLVEKLKERETFYISNFNTREHGFNGNDGGTGRKGVKISQEEIDRRTATRKKNGFHHTPASKMKISDSSRKRKKSQEERDKISAKNRGKKRTAAQKQAQSDRMKGKEPIAASEGLKAYIKERGHGPTKGIKQTAKAKANMKKAQQANGVRVKAILFDGTEKEYTTMLDAAKGCGVGVGSVYNCIKTGGKTKSGISFEKL